MSDDADDVELSEDDFSEEEIDEIKKSSKPQEEKKKGRKPIDAMRLAPKGPFSMPVEEWTAQRYSIPFDPCDDDDLELSDESISSVSSSEKEEEEPHPVEPERRHEVIAGLANLPLVPLKRPREEMEGFDDELSEDLPDEPLPQNAAPEIPNAIPPDMMTWAITRFMLNGGLKEDEAAFRMTMRELWERYIADMLYEMGSSVKEGPPAGLVKRPKIDENDNDDDIGCWLCSHGLGASDKILSTRMQCFKELFHAHALTMHPRVLGSILYDYYHDYIYEPMIKEGKNPPKWTRKLAIEHLTVHTRDPRVRVTALDDQLTDILGILSGNIFEPGSTDIERPTHRPEVLRDYLAVFDRFLRLRKSDPKKMNGYDPDVEVDMKKGYNLVRYANLKTTIEEV